MKAARKPGVRSQLAEDLTPKSKGPSLVVPISLGASTVSRYLCGGSRRHDWVSLDLDIDLGSFLKLNFSSLFVLKRVGNAYLAIQVIGALHRDLGFLWFTGEGLRRNYFFDFSWKRGTYFSFL